MSVISDIKQGLAMLPPQMNSKAAIVLLLATQKQENPRRLEQQVGGPARSDLQFEKGGGVKGVMTHPSVRGNTQTVVRARGVAFDAEEIYQAIGHDQVLAYALGRLLYWTDSGPMPTTAEEAWDVYLRTWRPGAYKREGEKLRTKFLANYRAALKEVEA